MSTQVHPSPSATEQAFTLNPLRWSQRTGALVAGIALTAMVFLSIFGYLIAINGLVTVNDATKTAAAITASPALWLAGIGAMCVVVVLDVVAAAGTFALFRPVNRVVSAVAGLMRTTYALFLTVALSQLVLAFNNLGSPEAALTAIESFGSIWNTALGLFGVALLLIAYLSIRSGFIPKIFGILIGIAGVGYIADLIGLVIVPGFTPTFGLFGFVGETAMIFWLLIGGRRLPRS
ncbi:MULTISPECIES: DUF4386 domain-containing protein [Cryobacterium]|uniref:DUF4386 domain-containing protein n=1 Tax=Cryobacterium breve TaxID=1259258 RepID=A0ABY2IWI3_9MICO|nr:MULTISPECIES: DUF4386 domain-containing protein [Cryobacterium]TFC93237.1 DUF4386 domain-containing protein [Cryobacterium sp. TmT3-12]TFC96382.1 DUF4386 domain-containing protein [Cryobacterium breve]